MAEPKQAQDGTEESHLIRCSLCLHFEYFQNALGHNSPHALGKCGADPWDGQPGQWPMFNHPCRSFKEKSPNP